MGRPWILVTGAGHGGTRLLIRLLARHPDVDVPKEHLTVAWELETLHEFFIQTMDRTRLHEPGLNVDTDELVFILDAYADHCGSSAGHVGLKMPHYPLLCLDALADAVDLSAILYAQRPVDKILRSNRKRGKEILYTERTVYLRQVKKCLVEDRRELLVDRRFEPLIRAQVRAIETALEDWNASERAPRIQPVDMESITTDPGTLADLLAGIGLDPEPASEMLEIVDRSRLEQKGAWYRFKQRQLALKNKLKALWKAGR